MADRDPPYPADTKAKGWRFEMDLEQVTQSDTWALAAEIPMAQHTLLMMWAVAWQQTPCGSMPADSALLRAKLRVPPKLWAPMADVVVRGWWLAVDGRLYHDTITSRVRDMLGRKDAERQRKAEYRARLDGERKSKESGNVPRDKHGTGDGQSPDGHGKDDTGTGTGTGTSNTPPSVPSGGAARKRAAPLSAVSKPDGVTDQTWEAWLAHRKKKGATVTESVVASAEAEASKARMTLEDFLKLWCFRGSQGLMADWIKPNERGANGRQTSHTGFQAKDYNAGVNADGSLV